jgi:thioesterase domain-containing protein
MKTADIVPEKLLKFRVDYKRRKTVPIRIPFKQNVNDKAMLFAGSLFSAAVLSAYYAVKFIFREKGLEGDLVCREARIRFMKPVFGHGKAETVEVSKIRKRQSGNYGITSVSVVRCARGRICSEIRCDFVLKPADKPRK